LLEYSEAERQSSKESLTFKGGEKVIKNLILVKIKG
jgi:hypothetical protein